VFVLSGCTTSPLGTYTETLTNALKDDQSVIHICREKNVFYGLLKIDLLLDEQPVAGISQGSNIQLVIKSGPTRLILSSPEYRQPRFLTLPMTLSSRQERYFFLGVNLDKVTVMPTPLIIFGQRSDRWNLREVSPDEYLKVCDGVRPIRLAPKN
jgi:hypothetical protein